MALHGSIAGRAIALASCIMLLGCGSAKISGRSEFAAEPMSKPPIVYVADFELDAANIQSEPGLLRRPPLPARRPLGNILPRPFGASEDPAVRAHELVELMATSLVKDLNKDGITARRLAPGQALPTTGWLLRGLFTEVNEGNRLRRAVIGFGQGQTQLQLVVAADDLAHGPPRPLYELATSAESGKMPGAAITLNPAAVAARFVLAGHDLDRNVTQTATEIADDVAAHFRK